MSLLALLLAIAPARAARADDVDAEAPPLELGEQVYFVEHASWTVGPATVALDRGFGFDVVLGDQPVGRVFVGEARHVLAAGDHGATLDAVLAGELGLTGVVDADGDWAIPADRVWLLGAQAVGERPAGWNRLRVAPPMLYDLDAEVQPAVLVVGANELTVARTRARKLISDRAHGLADAGLPLASMLAAGAAAPGESWAVLEAATDARVGALAGTAARVDEPWLTTLRDDPMLASGSSAATITVGERAVPGRIVRDPHPTIMEQVLIDRSDLRVVRGYRRLATTAGTPPWAVRRADVTWTIPRLAGSGQELRVTGEALLDVVPTHDTRWIAVELPWFHPSPGDIGETSVEPAFRVESVTDPVGVVLASSTPSVDTDTELAWRPRRRLLLVKFPEPVPAGESRVVDVRWSQRVPYGRIEAFPYGNVHYGSVTPPLPAVPVVVGDDGVFPYRLDVEVTAPEKVAVSGALLDVVPGRGSQTFRSAGLVGGAARLAVGRWEEQALGLARVLSPNQERDSAARVALLAVAVADWSGAQPLDMEVARLTPTVAPAHVEWGEGWVGIVPDVDVEKPRWAGNVYPHDLGDPVNILGLQGVAAASWAERAGQGAEATAWVEAFAGAFAIAHLGPKEAVGWRKWMQGCASTFPPREMALSPAEAATTGYREISTRCAAPLVLGPMLDDRLGVDGASRVRRALLGQGPVLDRERVGAAVLAEDPSAGPWVRRWIDLATVPDLDLAWTATEEEGGYRVTGTVRADGDMGGAPVVVRVGAGRKAVDVVVPLTGREAAFSVHVRRRPLLVTLDPARRVLRRATSEVG